jgi:hypothetical protein
MKGFDKFSFDTFRKLSRPSAKSIVIAVSTCLTLSLLFGRDARQFFVDQFRPHISFREGGMRNGREQARDEQTREAVIFDGEVYRTENRLREASAVAIAVSLAGVAAYAERHPARDVTDLLRGVVQRGLLPPGVEYISERNLLRSAHSTIYVRLRPVPFTVEVLSIGRERLDGSALILRVPDEKPDKSGQVSYFYSLSLSSVKIPEPFVPTSSVLAAGWQQATFKPQLPTGANAQRLFAWAGEQR